MEANTKQSVRHSCMLLLAALVWGVAFVAQSEGLNYVETFTFNTCRFILGGAVLIPCFISCTAERTVYGRPCLRRRKKSRPAWALGGICCGCILCLASCLQQFGIGQTTVGKCRIYHDTVHHHCAVYGAVLKEKNWHQYLDQRSDLRLWVCISCA